MYDASGPLLQHIYKYGCDLAPHRREIIAAIMEYTSASMSFSLLGANEAALHVPGGGGSEEQPPSLDVSDYISIDEGSSQLEEYSPAFAFTGECYQDPFLLAEDTGESSMVGRTSSSL